MTNHCRNERLISVVQRSGSRTCSPGLQMIQAAMSSPEASLNFLRDVLRFCEACAARCFVAEEVQADYTHFGSWSIRIDSHSKESRRQIVFEWDGREGRLQIKERLRDEQGLWPLCLINDMKLATSKGEDPFTQCLEYLDAPRS